MYLQVPEQYVLGVEKLISAKNEAINALKLAFQEISPTLELTIEISERASKSGEIDRASAWAIVDFVLSLYSLKEDGDSSTEEITSSLCKSIADDERFSEISKQELDNLEEKLNILLSVGSTLKVSRKALDLVAEYERLYSGSKIVTDVRPVFDSKTERQLDAAIVVHTLKVLYRDMQGLKEFYVAISSDDLEDLGEQIIIALENRKAIKTMLEKAEVDCITSSLAFDEDDAS